MRIRSACFLALAIAAVATAAPLSKELEIDFFREAPNRNLKGIAVRSDGRLLDGPLVRNLEGELPADLLWTLVPGSAANSWLIGTGPEGKVFRVDLKPPGAFGTEMLIDLEATHVFALGALPDGGFLAGTSPQGTLSLVRGGAVVAAVTLPVDSILDVAILPGAQPAALVSTGNPGRIYRVDLAKFAAAGETKDKLTSADELAKRGITLFGEIRDRNIRRLLVLADGRVIAGSAPKGNVYSFAADGGAPLILLENREAEVSDLLAGPDGSFYAAVTLAAPSGDTRLNRTPTVLSVSAAPVSDTSDDTETSRFSGRGQLIHFPAGGLPETVVSRSNTAFYRLAWHETEQRRWILVSGGEEGELVAYSPAERRSINLGATTSAQANAILPAGAGTFLLLRNNAAGLSLVDFSPTEKRSIETRRLDLGVPADLGQIRFGQIRGVAPEQMRVSVRTSFGSDELEGWSGWTELRASDGGWFAPDLRGRYVQYRIELDRATDAPLIDRATVYYLPQNRRPQLTDFRIFSPNLALIPAPEPPPAPTNTTLGQLLFPNQRESKDDSSGGAKRRSAFLNSQVVPQPGAQLIFWTLTDPDDDNIAATFSIAPENTDDWTDLAIRTTDSYVQFDVTHLREGRYRTRLVAEEQAPRRAEQRLSYTFETDSLTIDRSAPEILHAEAARADGVWRIRVEGRDVFNQLDGAEFILNNGQRMIVEQPLDGVLDGRHETFVAEFTEPRAAGATSVEIVLYDGAGNTASRRVPLQ